MQGKCRLKGVSRDYKSNHILLTLEFEEGVTSDALSRLQDKDLSAEIKPYKERRSLDSNSYFHLLCGKLAECIGVSKPRMKNMMLGKYGQFEYLPDGTMAMIKTNIPPEKMMELEYLHTSLIRFSDDGVPLYRIIRGTHTYDTKEMSALIDGVVQECKDMGIETMTPDQIKRMEAAWNPRS